jgi:hypothetical protein
MSILGETHFIGTSVLTEQNKAVIRNEFLPAHKASGAIHTFYFQTSHTSYTVVALWKDTETRDAGLKSLAPVFEHAASMGFHRSHSVVGENFCRFGSGPSHDGYVTAWEYELRSDPADGAAWRESTVEGHNTIWAGLFKWLGASRAYFHWTGEHTWSAVVVWPDQSTLEMAGPVIAAVKARFSGLKWKKIEGDVICGH